MAIAAERIRTISVTKMHPVIGAEIGGVDLCRPLDAETLRQIKDAWHEHSVLLFRGQSLSEDDQRRFASYFGPVAKRVPPKPGATGVGDAPAWNDMMLVSDKLDANGKPLGTLGRDVVPHRQVLPPAPTPRLIPLWHRDPVGRRPHEIFEHVCRL